MKGSALVLGYNIAMDLGTAMIRVYIEGKGMIINEPSVAAVDRHSKSIIAVGNEAKKMIGRVPPNIEVIRPLRQGVVSDFDVASDMIKLFVGKIARFSFIRPRLAISVPSLVTEDERKAVVDAALISGTRNVFIIEEPLAAALGSGIDISVPDGRMVIDVGGETTDIAVISLDGIVVSTTVKTGGFSFDYAIEHHIRDKYNISIGELSAEQLKIAVGTLYPEPDNKMFEIKGRGIKSGLPEKVLISAGELAQVMMEPAQIIAQAVCDLFEKVPPELSGDIIRNGILMTGGGSHLNGLDHLITAWSSVPASVAGDPELCVVKGTSKAFGYPQYFKSNTRGASDYQR
jgi:rod shape-determining protein MreB